jgi:hypothetical protein
MLLAAKLVLYCRWHHVLFLKDVGSYLSKVLGSMCTGVVSQSRGQQPNMEWGEVLGFKFTNIYYSNYNQNVYLIKVSGEIGIPSYDCNSFADNNK